MTACLAAEPAVFESPSNPDRFSSKERGRFAVVVLYPKDVKRQLRNATVAKARALEIARRQIENRLYLPPDLDAMQAWAEIVTLDLYPLGDVHRTLDDGTKVWLRPNGRADGVPWPPLE